MPAVQEEERNNCPITGGPGDQVLGPSESIFGSSDSLEAMLGPSRSYGGVSMTTPLF